MAIQQPKQLGLLEGLTPEDLITALNEVDASATELSFIRNFMREVQENSRAFEKNWTGMGSLGMTTSPLTNEIKQGNIE